MSVFSFCEKNLFFMPKYLDLPKNFVNLVLNILQAFYFRSSNNDTNTDYV